MNTHIRLVCISRVKQPMPSKQPQKQLQMTLLVAESIQTNHQCCCLVHTEYRYRRRKHYLHMKTHKRSQYYHP